jgi:hypothetical protein
MLFTFKKIRETIAALKSKKTKPPKNYPHSEKNQYSMKFMDHPPSKKAVNFVVMLVILLPCVWLFNYLLRSFAESCNVGAITGIGAIFLTVAYETLREKLFTIIPFYKLNPYFGSKLDETINALRKKKLECPKI